MSPQLTAYFFEVRSSQCSQKESSHTNSVCDRWDTFHHLPGRAFFPFCFSDHLLASCLCFNTVLLPCYYCTNDYRDLLCLFIFFKADSIKKKGARDMECQATENANVYCDSLRRAMYGIFADIIYAQSQKAVNGNMTLPHYPRTQCPSQIFHCYFNPEDKFAGFSLKTGQQPLLQQRL